MVKRVKTVWWLGGALAASVLVVAVSPALAQRTTGASAGLLPEERSGDGVQRSSCVLMLRNGMRYAGPGMSGINNGMADLSALTTAMTTTGLIDPAAKAALGLGPREWPAAVRIEVTPAGAQAVKLSVIVDAGPNGLKEPEPATALLHELIDRAKGVVSQSAEPRRQEVKARLDEIEKRRAELRASIESLRKRVREAEANGYRGGMAMGPDPVMMQRQQLESQLTAKRPRLQALKEILPRLEAQTDDLGTALRGLVAAREALVAGLEKAAEQGKGDPVELLRARADLAEARVRAAEGGRVPPVAPSRNVRDELVNLEVDIAALEAQLKALPAPSDDAAKPPGEDPQQLRSELMRAENENNNLEMQYQQVRRDYDQLASPPTLVVLDGEPK